MRRLVLAADDGGVNALVPLKSFVLGVGEYATGNRMLNANRTGGADCTT